MGTRDDMKSPYDELGELIFPDYNDNKYRVCENCDREYIAKSPNQKKFCSRACLDMWQRDHWRERRR